MLRKDFIKSCGYACLGVTSIGMLLQSCISSKVLTVEILGENIILPFLEFEKVKDDEVTIQDYIIIQNSQLQYPIYVFRFSEKEYSALYLRCTHQGVELNAYGERLVCSAHGSEFDNKGKVINGPAGTSLKSFPVKLDNQNIIISLKKV